MKNRQSNHSGPRAHASFGGRTRLQWRQGSKCASGRAPGRQHEISSHAEASLRCARVLVVEDDFLAAQRLCRLLGDLGCEVIGPAATPDAAEALLSRHPTAAVLDVRLGPQTAFQLAEELKARGVAILFATAESPDRLPPTLRDSPVLSKPFTPAALAAALARAIA